nr:type II toxin-antitoxin system HicB family antitoxin [Methanocalculus taiwanensis]
MYITFGETIDEAIEIAKEAIELYIEHLLEKGEERSIRGSQT